MKRAWGGAHAESPPHMNTATPLNNYHHNSHGRTKYNAASHCHSYILLLLSNVMLSPGSSSLQLAAMVPVSPALSRDSVASSTTLAWLRESTPPKLLEFPSARRGTAPTAVQRCVCTRAGGKGHRVQLLRWQWLHVQQQQLRTVMGPGLTNPHAAPCDQHWPLLRILQHRIHFC